MHLSPITSRYNSRDFSIFLFYKIFGNSRDGEVASHVVHEERMVGPCRDDSDFDAIAWIPVEELIVHKHLNKY